MDNKKINLTELDFDLIKSNLKEFLKGQDQLSDYDFEGSTISILLDILAYNTHYNALYTNLAVNESFLDSASKRSSVVSLAKSLGYIPDSDQGAIARVSVIVTGTTSTPDLLTLPKFTPFLTSVDGQSYTFYTLENYVTRFNSDTNNYTFENVAIKEGTPLTFRYEAGPGVKYILPNDNIDISTISVKVQDNVNSSIFEIFNREEEILELQSDSKVFFLKELEDEFYEIEFGNGTIGKKLNNGNIVTIEYLTCNANLTNGAKSFSYQGSSLLGGAISVITTDSASGGITKEGIDTVRYNAPRSYSAQNRGVTVNDYRSLILEKYSEADSVNVWGGEDNLPPIYGKVFISIKPKTTNNLSETQKSLLVNDILKPRNVVTITPEIVDVEFINIQVDTAVYYNSKATNKKDNDIRTIVTNRIQEYSDVNLNSFDGIFRYSMFTSFIDRSDPSIINNITTIKIHREVEPKYNSFAQYRIELGNPIHKPEINSPSIVTTGFYMSEYGETVVYLEDILVAPNIGNFRIFTLDSNSNKQYLGTIGEINYSSGSIKINNFNIIGIDSNSFKFIIKPQSNDVVSVRNQLVRILPNLVTVQVIPDKIAAGDAAGNSNYIFTPSRN